METIFDIRQTVIAYLRQRQAEKGLTAPLGPASAVFAEGLLDSVALIELLAAVEEASGQAVDMLRFDPAGVETLDDLVGELGAALAD